MTTHDIYHAKFEDVVSEDLIPDQSCDAIITDLPYGTTAQSYDTPLDLEWFWWQCLRICKPNGAIVLFSQQPFTTDIMNVARPWFSSESIVEGFFEAIYHKTHAQGFLSARKKPMRAHENILIFYPGSIVYNWQDVLGEGVPYRVEYKRDYSMSNYGREECGRKGTVLDNKGTRFPRSVYQAKDYAFESSVLTHSNSNNTALHPHMKPLSLMSELVRTFTNVGDTVLDATAGSFTTNVACAIEDRNSIGVEIDEDNFNMGVMRLEELDIIVNKYALVD